MSATLTNPARFTPAGSDSATNYIDLGSEPPLTVGTPSVGAPARRAVSVRWLSGTILTGFTSFVLIGGALIAVLNGQELVATPPESTDVGALSRQLANGQKGDRIMPVAAPPSTREIIPVSTVVRQDDRDLIQQRPYVLINAALATATADGVEVPPYDPVTIVGEAANNGDPPAEPVTPAGGLARGDVDGGNAAVRTLPFPLNAALSGPEVKPEEIEEIVRGNAAFFDNGDLELGVFAYANAAGVGFGALQDDALAELGVRIIPENVSFLSKTGEAGLSRGERIIAIEDGLSLDGILADAGMADDAIAAAISVMDGLIELAVLTSEHRVRIAFAPSATSVGGPLVLRVSIYENEAHQATVARNDDNVFVRADEPAPLPEMEENTSRVVSGVLPRLYEALFLTGIEQEMPPEQINDLIRIFAFELDMQARIGPADSVRLFCRLLEVGVTDGDQDEILFASVTLAGVANSYYRFQTPDGVVKYYDAEGRSADNFLLRKPMSGGEYRSGYGNRLHPILRVYRLHNGVDWTAPYGAPIVAAGDGVVVEAKYNSGGYGNYTVIQHANGYETAYAHQSRIAPGIEPGAIVRQGQVIGYVGSTGLSTGNHLHYEVRINGQTVNPVTIRLPQGRVLAGETLAAFHVQRDQIIELIGVDDDGTKLADNR